MWVQARVPLFLLLGSLSIVGSFGFALLHPTAQHPTRFFATSATEQDIPKSLDGEQLRFTLGYLNKHEGDALVSFAETFSELGKIKREKNAFTGGSYMIESAEITKIDQTEMTLQVVVKQAKNLSTKEVSIPLDASPVIKVRNAFANMSPIPGNLDLHPVDDIIRRLNRLCWISGNAETTGRLVQMGIQIGGLGVGKLKENMYLNQVPHNRYIRQYFYDMAAEATLEAVALCSQGEISNLMKVTSMFPEMNPSMDSYRIGTLLEMTRAIAIRLCEQNLRVRVCVQAPMGSGIFTGLPKQLSGVSKLLQMMDWQSNEGEENEGMVGEYLNFGSIGEKDVINKHIDEDGNEVEQDDVFLVIAPQSMVGVDSSIIGALQAMTEAAGDRPVILINPDLVDKNIYVSGTSYFPILGSMTKLAPRDPWIAHQRRDLVNDGGEVYVPILACEERPDGEAVLAAFQS